MSWNELIYYAIASILCWVAGAVVAFKSQKRWHAATLSIGDLFCLYLRYVDRT